MTVRLGVNLDHVATVRQARGTAYPDILDAAHEAIAGGAEGITVHLREDKRHIQEDDVKVLRQLSTPLNLEMAPTKAMLTFAQAIQPAYCCLVPEKREELTTEGGLDVVALQESLIPYCQTLSTAGMQVSLFIDPHSAAIDAAMCIGAPIIELHTGEYANANTQEARQAELAKIVEAASYARAKGLIVNAGHGLTLENVGPVAAIEGMHELNIGHSIVARALMVGLRAAVAEMQLAIKTHQSST